MEPVLGYLLPYSSISSIQSNYRDDFNYESSEYMAQKFGVPKIGVGCGKQTKISHAAQKKYGQSNKNKTHIARGIGPMVKKI